MPFGKYCNFEIEDIPTDYLRWMLRADVIRTDELREAVELELLDRGEDDRYSDRNTRRKKQNSYTPPPPPPPPPPPFGKVQIYVAPGRMTLFGELIECGFRVLAKKKHPDHGGTSEQFRELMELREELKAALP